MDYEEVFTKDGGKYLGGEGIGRSKDMYGGLWIGLVRKNEEYERRTRVRGRCEASRCAACRRGATMSRGGNEMGLICEWRVRHRLVSSSILMRSAYSHDFCFWMYDFYAMICHIARTSQLLTRHICPSIITMTQTLACRLL